MRIFNLNRGIGWASSGVEYAQIYRARLLRMIHADAKFIFTDLFTFENIEHLTKAIGFQDEEVIWLYGFFTDFSVEPCSYTFRDLEKTLEEGSYRTEEHADYIRYVFQGKDAYINAYFARGYDRSRGITDENRASFPHSGNDFVQRTELVIAGNLLRKDFYSSGKIFSEYYARRDDKAVEYLRIFFNRNGSVALEEMILGEEKSIFKVGKDLVYSKEELIAKLIRELALTREDVVIIDRATEIGQAVIRNRKEACVGTVVHAEHYNEPSEKEDTILWNNYYEYEFSNADQLSFIITSTLAQEKILRRQMKKYRNLDCNIVTIPVGSLHELTKRRQGNGEEIRLITASRLASEKHVDVLVDAVAQAHRTFPQIRFDIYGKGAEENPIRELIKDHHAEEYIRLCGHQELHEIYPDYDVYLSASTSEGFGLTLMEAVGAGLAMIGFDVHYGNQTFIDPEKNGYLLPYHTEMSNQKMAEAIAEAICKICDPAKIEAFSKRSYAIAEEYLSENVAKKWEALLKSLSQGESV